MGESDPPGAGEPILMKFSGTFPRGEAEAGREEGIALGNGGFFVPAERALAASHPSSPSGYRSFRGISSHFEGKVTPNPWRAAG